MRNEARSPVNDLRVPDEKPGTRETPQQLVIDEFVDSRTRHGHAEQEEPEQYRQHVRVAEAPQVRRELG